MYLGHERLLRRLGAASPQHIFNSLNLFLSILIFIAVFLFLFLS